MLCFFSCWAGAGGKDWVFLIIWYLSGEVLFRFFVFYYWGAWFCDWVMGVLPGLSLLEFFFYYFFSPVNSELRGTQEVNKTFCNILN